MATIILGEYQGHLRNMLLHEQSASKIITDAPLDNHGKGETFSPTDLVAAALGSCMLTIIGLRADSRKIKIGNPSYTIKKHMNSYPRKISKIELQINFKVNINQENRSYLEHEAINCPVALSLDKNLIQEVSFNYT